MYLTLIYYVSTSTYLFLFCMYHVLVAFPFLYLLIFQYWLKRPVTWQTAQLKGIFIAHSICTNYKETMCCTNCLNCLNCLNCFKLPYSERYFAKIIMVDNINYNTSRYIVLFLFIIFDTPCIYLYLLLNTFWCTYSCILCNV